MHADATQEFLCLIVTHHFESDVVDALAARAREPERSARRRGGGERRVEAHRVDSSANPVFQRFQAAEKAQAARYLQKQRLRRLERNLRRELARPGADRLE